MQTMQQKPRLLSVKNIGIFIVAIAVVGVISLTMIDIAAPQKPVEKVLDAKTFLDQK